MERLVTNKDSVNDNNSCSTSGPTITTTNTSGTTVNMRKLNLDVSGRKNSDIGDGIVNKGHTCEKDNLSDSGFEINDVGSYI